jgi:hypothetical protein
MQKSTAPNASRRWTAAAETQTIGSPGRIIPTRWTIKFEAIKRAVGQFVHSRQGERFVVGKLQRFDSLILAHLSHEIAHPAEAGIGLRERADQHAREEHLMEQANVAHQPPETGGSSAISSPALACNALLSDTNAPFSATRLRGSSITAANASGRPAFSPAQSSGAVSVKLAAPA